MNPVARMAKDLYDILNSSGSKKPKPYDSTATVVQVEGNIAWVRIPGSSDVTPIRRTIDAKEGDSVQIRVANGDAWMVGNISAPPTDNTLAYRAMGRADSAYDKAEDANIHARQLAADNEEALKSWINVIEPQIDKKIETWYQASNPASAWTTADLKESHVGDIWYDTINQKYYSWTSDGATVPTYSWDEITATPPSGVMNTINRKAQIFLITPDDPVPHPEPPYSVGDLWYRGDEYDVLTCVMPKSAFQSYADTDWVKNETYTDDTAASNAQGQATLASSYANAALSQLGVVENVVGALEWISKHGEYSDNPTDDPEPIPGKWYYERSGTVGSYTWTVVPSVEFDYILTEDTTVNTEKTYYTRSGTSPDYTYTAVANPVDADLGTYYEFTDSPHLHGYYELVSVDQAVTDYIMAHVAVDGQGLWIQVPEDGFSSKLQLSSTDGVVLWGSNGRVMAKYGSTAIIGDEENFHIEISGQRLTFYDADGATPIAYISNNRLYITQVTVLDKFDLGTPVNDGGHGQWAWTIHANGVGGNNLGLKWMG